MSYLDWKVGDKVVCTQPHAWLGLLQGGAVYTVSATGTLASEPFIGLAELPCRSGIKLHWKASRFCRALPGATA